MAWELRQSMVKQQAFWRGGEGIRAMELIYRSRHIHSLPEL